jgi:hypothetical protein
MLLKFAGIKKQYAIGMRWAVDDRKGIEAIQFNTSLNYGIMLDLKEKGVRTLKLVALADDSHNKALCLAGLLASQYENLILVHRMSDTAYWVCVIKSHVVWTGVDVPKATAGDYVSTFASVSEVVDIAKAEFVADGIDIQNILLCSETASEDFSDFKAVDFFSFITKRKKDRKFIVRYLEPSKILLRKVLVLVFVIMAALAAVYYVHQQQLVSRLIHQKQIEEEQQRQAAIKAKVDYFTHLQSVLHYQSGYVAIKNVFSLLSMVPLQSAGWNLTTATYNPQSPKTLAVLLNRSEYGTLDSFLSAYSKTPTNGAIDNSNNSGKKTLTFDNMQLQESTAKISQTDLVDDIPRAAYRLISYMQLNQDTFQFKLKGKNRSQYGVNSITFSISGEKLWKLVQLDGVLKSFPTLTIASINFVVNDYDMSWTLEGEIYA